jgi:hypothetical protein
MIIDTILEKVTTICCTDVGKTGDVSTTPDEPVDDVMEDETKDEVESKEATEPVTEERVLDIDIADFTGKETKFELTKWGDLPSDVSKAAEALGYDQEKWDADEFTHASHKHWDDLTEEECKAVEILGWDKGAWEKKYEDFSFADIPAHVKRAAESVGFTEITWNEDSWPEATDKWWDDLSFTEKSAYSVLGYTKKSWDH